MAEQSSPPTSLFEAERKQALERFALLCSTLEQGVSQTQIVCDHQVSQLRNNWSKQALPITWR
jgi:hypothetical protein